MEVRIAKMEKELAIMSASLSSISKTLDKMSEIQLENRLLEVKWSHMNEELKDSFKRVHIRQDKVDATLSWVTRTVVGAIIVALVTIITHGVST